MILEVKNLRKSFSQGNRHVDALKGISFQVETNQSLAIVGPSGSGKTTLLSLLAGLDKTSEGEIIFSGQPIQGMKEKELNAFRAENIGIVFQQFHLMPHLSALENVALPLDILGRPNSEESAKEMLAQVGLADRLTHRPHQLSGGECQRVAIARASVTRPKILLADEPSGNLDTETGKKVMDLLFKLVTENNMTLILITHNQELADRCKNKIQLVGGQLQ